MPTTYVVANRASNTLSSGLSANPTTIAVTDASAFPSPTAGQAAYVLIRAAADYMETGVYAVYQYTSRSGNTLSGVTYVGGTNGAGGGTWASGDVIANRDVAEFIAKLSQIDANESVTGVKTFADGASVQAGAERFTLLTSAPADPPSTQMAAWARQVSSGFPVPLFGVSDGLGSTNRDPFGAVLQSPVYDRWFWVAPLLTSSIVPTGQISVTSAGGFTGPSPSIGSTRSETARGFFQSTSANSGTGVSANISLPRQFWRGNATGRGGFEFVACFGLEGITSNLRLFAGVTDHVASANVVSAGNPSATTSSNSIALIADQADTDLTIGTCNGTTFTKTPLTTGRTKTTAANQLYELTIACAPNSATMRFRLVELASSGYGRTVLHDADISTTLPLNTAFLRFVIGVNGGTTTDTNQFSVASIFGHWKAP